MTALACEILPEWFVARGRADCWRPSRDCRDSCRAAGRREYCPADPIVNPGQRVAIPLAKHLQRLAILPLNKFQRPRAFDLFQPQIGIIVWSGKRRLCRYFVVAFAFTTLHSIAIDAHSRHSTASKLFTYCIRSSLRWRPSRLIAMCQSIPSIAEVGS